MTIHLPPDVEENLSAQARAHGMPLPQYVEQILREQVPPAAPHTPAQRATAWRESVQNLPDTAPLPDEAMKRESFYGDRSR